MNTFFSHLAKCLLVLAVTFSGLASAATWQITNSSSFNNAVRFANHGDILSFNLASPKVLTLSGSIRITKNITIKGNGSTIQAPVNYLKSIYIDTDNVAFEDLIFKGFRGQEVLDIHANTVNITRCRFIDNIQSGHGGAIFMRKKPGAAVSELNILSSEFTNNRVPSSRNGGAIYVNSGTQLNVYNSIFKDNKAIGGGGGAITVIGNGNAPHTITNSTFTNNESDAGGAIFTLSSDFKLSGNTFANNRAARQGSAVYIHQTGATVDIHRSTFVNNHSSSSTTTISDAIYVGANTLNMSNNVIVGRTSHALCEVASNGSINAKYNVTTDNSCDGSTPVNNQNVASFSLSSVISSILSDNGCANKVGPTNDASSRCAETLILPANSPAINVGMSPDLSATSWDQRGDGYPRITNGAEDAGAIAHMPAGTPLRQINLATQPSGLSPQQAAAFCSPSPVPSGWTVRCRATSNNANITFTGFSGDCTSATNTCNLTAVNSAKNIVATFNASSLHTITTGFSPNNGGTFSCDKAMAASGEIVTCTAVPNAADGYVLLNFDNQNCVVDANDPNVCRFTNVTANQSITATFRAPTSYTITTASTPMNAGTFSCDQSSATSTATVTCTANPDASQGYVLVNFDNANCVVDANNANVCRFSNLSANQSVTATFLKSMAIFSNGFEN